MSSNQSQDLRFVGNMSQPLQFDGLGDDEDNEALGIEAASAQANSSLYDAPEIVEGLGHLIHKYASTGLELEAEVRLVSCYAYRLKQ